MQLLHLLSSSIRYKEMLFIYSLIFCCSLPWNTIHLGNSRSFHKTFTEFESKVSCYSEVSVAAVHGAESLQPLVISTSDLHNAVHCLLSPVLLGDSTVHTFRHFIWDGFMSLAISTSLSEFNVSWARQLQTTKINTKNMWQLPCWRC